MALLSVVAVALFLSIVSGRAWAQTAVTTDTQIQASSSGEHLWLISRDPKGPAELPYFVRYHSEAMAGPSLAVIRHLSRRPDFMLAADDRLYIVWQRSDPTLGHEVASLRVLHNPSFDAYYGLPQDRFETHAALPAGRVAAMTEHSGGPVALIMPRRDIEGSVETPTLLQLRNTGWVNWNLPAGFDPSRRALLASDMESGRRLIVMQGAHDDSNTTVVYSAADDQQWARAEIALDINSVRAVCRATGRAVIIQYNAGDAECGLGFLRPSEVLWFATLKPGADVWQVVGSDTGLQLLRRTETGAVTLSSIDPISGTAAEAQELRPHATKLGRIWFIALVLAGALGVTLLVMLIRPPKEATPPEGLAPLPAMQRFAAIAVDVFPAAVVTLLVTRCSVAELLQAPLVTPKLIMSWQYLMLVGLTLLHTTITELARGTTIGKALLGARVVTYSGEKPSARQAFIRALGKLMTLLVPPTAVIMLFSRVVQGLDDLLAHTIVVHQQQQPAGRDSSDQ